MNDAWLLDPVDQRRTVSTAQDLPGRNPNFAIWTQLGQARLFNMSELPMRVLQLGVSWRKPEVTWKLEVFWQQTGAELYREDYQFMSLSVGRTWRSGLYLERRSRKIGAGDMVDFVRPVLEIQLPLQGMGLPRTRLEVRVPLNRIPDRFGQPGRGNLARLVRPGPPVGLAMTVDRLRTGWLAVGMDILLRLSEGLGFGARLDPTTGSIGPTTVWRRGRLLIRTSHIAHPDLGLTHRACLVLGLAGEAP